MNARSHFFEGANVLGTKSGANALFSVGLSAFWMIVVVAIAPRRAVSSEREWDEATGDGSRKLFVA